MIRRPAALALAVLMAVCACGRAAAEDRALVIGVNQYPNLPGRNLSVAVSDARRFSALLVEKLGFEKTQIKSLIDADATREAIIATFRDWLLRGTKAGDRAVFYFSGHGLRLIKDGVDTNALAPNDVAKAQDGGRAEFDRVIFSDELTALRHELAGRRILFIVDSCYSGKIARQAQQDDAGGADAEVKIKTLTPDAVGVARPRATLDASPIASFNHEIGVAGGSEFALWAAVAPNQIALEDLKGGGGVFTSALIAGIREVAADTNRNGRIEVVELLNHVSEASKAFCARHRRACPDGLTPDLTAVPEDAYRTSVFWPIAGAHGSGQTGSGFEITQAAFEHQNDFDLRLEIAPGPVVPVGANIYFRVTSSERGRLLLFDQAASGSFRQIFPNRYSLKQNSSRFALARTTMEFPRSQDGFRYTASTKGKSFAMALLIADDNIRLDDLTKRFDDLEVVSSPRKLVGAIAARLQAPIIDSKPDVPDRRARWAFAWVEYEVR